jgi:biopolymer transport protein TolR
MMSQINVVPYIDVMLVLLIIFMVTAPLLQSGVEVDLPEAQARAIETDPDVPEPVVVTVNAQGEFFLGNSRVEPARLAEQVQARLAERRQDQAFVRGDRSVAYGRVVEAMVLLQGAGIEKIGLITDPPPESAGGA